MSRPPDRVATNRRWAHGDSFLLEHAADGRTLLHAILERGVVLKIAHWELAPDSPSVEHEPIGIDHGVSVEEPVLAGQHVVDLLEVAVKGLQTARFERRKHRGIGRVPFRPADVGVRRMHARGEEADQRERSGFGQRIAWPQAEPFAEVGQDRRVLRERLAVVEPKDRHAALRVDLEIGFRALLVMSKVDLARRIGFAALLQHDVRGERTRAGSEIKCEHG